MSASAIVKNLIRVAGSRFTIQDVTLQRAGWHLIQIAGETNADSPAIRNVIFRNAWEQMLKVSYDSANTSIGSDNGLVENAYPAYSVRHTEHHISECETTTWDERSPRRCGMRTSCGPPRVSRT